MPLYSIKNTETGEVTEMNMSMADRETFLKENPHMTQVFSKAPSIGDSVRLGIRRIDDNFNDVLKGAKKGHRNSTINTR